MIVADERSLPNRPLSPCSAVDGTRVWRLRNGRDRLYVRYIKYIESFRLKCSSIYLMRRVNCFKSRCGVFLFLIWTCHRGTIYLWQIYIGRILQYYPTKESLHLKVPLMKSSYGALLIFAVRTSAPSLGKATAICSHRMVRQPQNKYACRHCPGGGALEHH